MQTSTTIFATIFATAIYLSENYLCSLLISRFYLKNNLLNDLKKSDLFLLDIIVFCTVLIISNYHIKTIISYSVINNKTLFKILTSEAYFVILFSIISSLITFFNSIILASILKKVNNNYTSIFIICFLGFALATMNFALKDIYNSICTMLMPIDNLKTLN